MVWHKTLGSGPVKAIVIHGWFSDHRIFTPIFDALDTDRHTYAFFDIRGYGRSRERRGLFHHRPKSRPTRSRLPIRSAGPSFT